MKPKSNTTGGCSILIYSNVLETGDIGLIQGAIDLSTLKGLSALKYTLNVRIQPDGDPIKPTTKMIITYKDASESKVLISVCTVKAIKRPFNSSVTIEGCQAVVNPASVDIKNGDYEVFFDPKTPTSLTFFGFDSDHNQIKSFNFDLTTLKATNPLVSRYPVQRTNQVFSRIGIKTGPQGDPLVEVYLADPNSRQEQILLYDVKQATDNGETYLSYEQQIGRGGSSFFVFRDSGASYANCVNIQSFSVFSPSKTQYVQIYASLLPAGQTTTIQVSGKDSSGNNLGYAEVDVSLVSGLYSDAEYYGPQTLQNYVEPEYTTTPINRNMFVGNNQKFEITGDTAGDFDIQNNNQYDVPEALRSGFLLANEEYGVLKRTDNHIQLFHPNFDYTKGFVPKLLDGDLDIGNDTLLRVDLVKETGKEGLLITTRTKGTSMYRVVYSKFEASDSIRQNFTLGNFTCDDAPEGVIPYFETLRAANGSLDYTWWIPLANDSKISIFKAQSSNFTIFTSLELDSQILGIRDASIFFCPIDIHRNPISKNLIEVGSYCQGSSDSRIWAFEVQSIADLAPGSSVTAQNRQLNTILGSSGQLQVCSFGSEYLILNSAEGNSALYAANAQVDASFNHLLDTEAGYSGLSKLICLNNQAGALVIGTNFEKQGVYSLVFGNRLGDIRNRYHSTNTFTVGKAPIELISFTSSALVVRNGQKFTYLDLNGPQILYKGKGDGDGQSATLKGTNPKSATGGASITEEFKYTFSVFTANVTLTAKDPLPDINNPGTYDLSSVVTITGSPLFNIRSQSQKILVEGSVRSDPTYQPSLPASFAANFEQIRTDYQTTIASSQSPTRTLTFTFLSDYTTPSQTVDSKIVSSLYAYQVQSGTTGAKAAVVVAAVENGSKLKAFVLNDKGKVSAAVAFQNDLITNPTRIQVQKNDETTFSALAVDDTQNLAGLYTFQATTSADGSVQITNAKLLTIIQNSKKFF